MCSVCLDIGTILRAKIEANASVYFLQRVVALTTHGTLETDASSHQQLPPNTAKPGTAQFRCPGIGTLFPRVGVDARQQTGLARFFGNNTSADCTTTFANRKSQTFVHRDRLNQVTSRS